VAIPIQYALDLLQRHSVAWHAASPHQPTAASAESNRNPR
jgi:hypothetical protein